jgi:hypothetical protein
MGMREVNSFQMGTAPSTPASLERPVAFDDGQECSRIRDEIVITTQNVSGAPANLLVSDVIDHLRCIAGAVTSSFGDKNKDTFDNALSFDQLREMMVAMTGKDFLINGKEINKYNLTDILANAVAANAVVLVTCEIVRSFQLQRLAHLRNIYCPGATQMRQLAHQYKRGATWSNNAKWAQSGNVSILTIFDQQPVKHDRWARVPRLWLNDEGGRISHGPDEACALFAAWERTAVGASTLLGLVNLRAKGDSALLEGVQMPRVVRDGDYLLPPGDFDLNALATVFFQLPESVDLNEVPTGIFTIEDPGQEINPLYTAWLHVPEVHEGFLDGHVKANVISQKDPEARVVNSGPTRAPNAHDHIAATLPVSILRPHEPAFETAAARAYVYGKEPVTFIPPAVTAAAQANVAAVGGDKRTQAAAIKQQMMALAKWVPGQASAEKSKNQGVGLGIAGHIYGSLAETVRKFF